MPKRMEMVGMQFHEFKVLSFNSKDVHGVLSWNCVCSCGENRVVEGAALRSGKHKSCGCKARELRSKRMTTHGRSKQSIYNIWRNMLQRCSKNAKGVDLDRYFNRGIRVCEEWHKLENFIADMGERPKGKTLDRIDNDKGYYKENCRWATPKEQANNTRANRILKYEGIEYTLAQLAEIAGIKYITLRRRLESGWSVERAVNDPVRKRGF